MGAPYHIGLGEKLDLAQQVASQIEAVLVNGPNVIIKCKDKEVARAIAAAYRDWLLAVLS